MKDYEPDCLGIELSGICNCSCIYCPFHGLGNCKEGQKSLMSWDTLNAVIEQIRKIPSIKRLSTTGAGEIFMHPEWYEMLQLFFKKTGIKEVNIYTNGMLLNEKNIEKLLMLNVEKLELEVSIDGKSAEENDYYRVGSHYEKVKANMKLLEERINQENLNSRVTIIITNCYPITEQNLKKINYKINSKIAEVPPFLKKDFPNVVLVSQNTFLYKTDDNAEKLKKLKSQKVSWPDDFYHRCVNLFHRLAINNRGELLRCSCGHAGIEGIGDVFSDDIYKLWKSDEKMNLAREHFVLGDRTMDFCEGCPGKGIGEYYLFIE